MKKYLKMNLQLFAESKTLKELLGDELYSQVTEKLGETQVDIVNNGNWVPVAKFNEANDTIKSQKKQLADVDTQLETLKKNTGDTETLKAEIARLQDENKTASEKHENELKDTRITNAIKIYFAGKVHDVDVAAGLIDRSQLVYKDDGTVIGIEDQAKTLEENKKFLFIEQPPTGTGGSKGGGAKGGGEPGPTDLVSALQSHYKS